MDKPEMARNIQPPLQRL